MRTVIHLSDLHFGRTDPDIIEPLIAQVHELKPDLVVVSGDLTQRARSVQFKEARRFLDALPHPQLVVPGNHDVPLFNVAARLLQPLRKYRRYIGEDLQPVYMDDEIVVVGINTARSLTIKDGRVNDRQIEMARRQLAATGDSTVKIIVTHHPFDLPPGPQHHDLVGKAVPAMRAFALCGADLLLAGHVHTSSAVSSAGRYDIPGYSALVVQAGTATSTRGRGETNSFNVLQVEAHQIVVHRLGWQPGERSFALAASQTFVQRGSEWFEREADGSLSAEPAASAVRPPAGTATG
ncbi:MAG: 3',5'-cyclic adenosine monophosphate phosphodiesterase CpdA [Herbaspirillum frisingense]|uniref:3',5'-cyclic adenosine monophosphate phosphodiesterase CpdA n=1 Tax=Herbaspirillum frisingense TaxID=92645 RepID=A0A7V8FW31_9BURK|nr:MAG: 3',5'-cyclic adenosine monophosphate phosphodiesterase CpdA [Herbaspirillum frisingense]